MWQVLMLENYDFRYETQPTPPWSARKSGRVDVCSWNDAGTFLVERPSNCRIYYQAVENFLSAVSRLVAFSHIEQAKSMLLCLLMQIWEMVFGYIGAPSSSMYRIRL